MSSTTASVMMLKGLDEAGGIGQSKDIVGQDRELFEGNESIEELIAVLLPVGVRGN